MGYAGITLANLTLSMLAATFVICKQFGPFSELTPIRTDITLVSVLKKSKSSKPLETGDHGDTVFLKDFFEKICVFFKSADEEKIKAPQALHNTPPLLGAPKVIL